MEPSVKTTWNDPMPGIKSVWKKSLLEALAKTCAEAKADAPADTGLLRNSIMYQMEGEEGGFNDSGGVKADSSDKIKEPKKELTGYIGTNVHYAIYQEAGTRSITPNPFLRPAIAIHIEGKSMADVMRKWDSIRAKGPLKFGESREGF